MPKYLMEQEVIKRIRKDAENANGQNALAKAKGISVAFMSDIINGRRPISARIAEKFGFQRIIVFIREK